MNQDSVEQTTGEAPQDDESVRPIWETIAALGAEVPDEEWAQLPTDLAANLGHYLYGHLDGE